MEEEREAGQVNDPSLAAVYFESVTPEPAVHHHSCRWAVVNWDPQGHGLFPDLPGPTKGVEWLGEWYPFGSMQNRILWRRPYRIKPGAQDPSCR